MTITSSQTGGFTSAPFLLRRRSRFVQSALTVERFLSAAARDIHLKDRGVVDEAVDGGERHRLIGKSLIWRSVMWTPGKPSIPPRIETNQQFAQDVSGRQQAFEKRAADGAGPTVGLRPPFGSPHRPSS